MKPSTTRNLLIFLLAFLGVGALFGGGVLIISPSGELIGMPLSMLDASPFRDFLIPGILLFVVLGICPLALIFALLKKVESPFAEQFNLFTDMRWPWSFSIYQAFALIIWIQLEMVFLHAVHWLHTFYMFYAVAMLVVALLPPVRNYYKK
ncbi:hypothetical protein [Dyadobacter frigoris]|uniref:Uncharacterized protein n=1 Tax=Dyadobacter frigoris TaxID=2576211 RepID=A0A4U6CU72_9BACT|nr:hypothetical protein [Dyadobacter frigoris]TKT86578.1 hypothetical protein FDK13_32085 [Dyadobacter frigoris]